MPKSEPALDDAAGWRKEARKLRKALEKATNNVIVFGARLDIIMQTPTSKERGSAVSKLLNELDMANDGIRYGELGVNFRTDDKKKVLAKLAKKAR
jgi:hypothetical protein